MISFRCPRCNSLLQAPETAAGTKFNCSCGQRLQVPEPPLPPLNKTVLGKLEDYAPPPPNPTPQAVVQAVPVAPPRAPLLAVLEGYARPGHVVARLNQPLEQDEYFHYDGQWFKVLDALKA